MLLYQKPDTGEFDTILLSLLCDSLTGSFIDNFSENDLIEWEEVEI